MIVCFLVWRRHVFFFVRGLLAVDVAEQELVATV
jgi:hypothetical protein